MRRDDVVVVGGGIAGTHAALAAREAGASVTLIEEQSAVGGYLRWTLSAQHGLSEDLDGKRGFEIAQRAWELLYDAGVNVQLNSTVWGVFDELVLGVVNPDSSYRLRADRIILATGSTDVAVPFQGWELAGVMTARAALVAMNLHRVLPGRRIGLVGNGSDLAGVQESLELAGASIALHVPDSLAAVATGDVQVQSLSDGGTQVEVDAVIIVNGVQPDAELALHAQVHTRHSPASGIHVPARDDNLMSSSANLYVVGDAAGNCDAAQAAYEGQVAGYAATNDRKLDDALDALARVQAP